MVEKMMMSQSLIMEQAYEDDRIRDKTTATHWMRKVINSFR